MTWKLIPKDIEPLSSQLPQGILVAIVTNRDLLENKIYYGHFTCKQVFNFGGLDDDFQWMFIDWQKNYRIPLHKIVRWQKVEYKPPKELSEVQNIDHDQEGSHIDKQFCNFGSGSSDR